MDGTHIHQDIENYIEEELNRKLKTRLIELKTVLQLDYPEYKDEISNIITEHSYPIRATLRLDLEKKTRKKKIISEDNKCVARTGKGNQCQRPRLPDDNYLSDGKHCRSHIHGLKHGDITDDHEHKMLKKRGRRGKHNKEFLTTDLDPNLYIQAVCINIEDVPYLIDENGVIYNMSLDMVVVGYLDNDIVKWF